MSSNSTTPLPDFSKVVAALLSVAGAAEATKDALVFLTETVSRLEEIEKNARRAPNSDSPLLLTQSILQDVSQALPRARKALSLLPSLADFDKAATQPNEIILKDTDLPKFIGPLLDNDVLREGDLVYVKTLRSGERLFRKLSGYMVGRKLHTTPFHLIYRQP